jgi:aryl-alcohol dehydrogenase-like predicted oxidoreductase
MTAAVVDYGSCRNPESQDTIRQQQSPPPPRSAPAASYFRSSSSVDQTNNNSPPPSHHHNFRASPSIANLLAIGSTALFYIVMLLLSYGFNIPQTDLALVKMATQDIQKEEEQQANKRDNHMNIIPNPLAYPRRPFITRNDKFITIPVLGFPSVALARLSNATTDQPIANAAIKHVIQDLQISYFDVAPEYGDGVAQERLGPAIHPYDRDNIFLAAKTMYRTENESQIDLDNTLRSLQTDYLDLYQFHSISTQDDIDTILDPTNGAMKTFQKAKRQGRIKAIGFSAHSEPMAIQMIQSGLVDTCMFPINFLSYHYGGIGQGVLNAAIQHKVGVVALKAGALGRLTSQTGNEVTVPQAFHHIPEWKRQEMIHYPVVTHPKYYTWYEPEDDPVELHKLILWALNQPGVSAVLPPGTLDLFDGIANMLRGKDEVPMLSEEDVEEMKRRYENMEIVPIFHNMSVAGSKVST